MNMITSLRLIKVVSPLFLLFLVISISSCKPAAPSSESGAGDLTGYELTVIPGSTIRRATLKDASGKLSSEGFILDNKKTGLWITYNPEGEIIAADNYVNGLLEGTSLKMSFRGQIDTRAQYHLGQLNGPWTQYKFGKLIEERNYFVGKLDGMSKSYDQKTWKLKQEVNYKNGLQDGIYRYYDENGNVTLEYEYKNGEKVSGGIVKQE